MFQEVTLPLCLQNHKKWNVQTLKNYNIIPELFGLSQVSSVILNFCCQKNMK